MIIDYTAIIVSLVGLFSTGAFWQYLQNKSKLNFEARASESAANLDFRASLIAQVEMLNLKVDKLAAEKEELMLEMAKIQMQLAEANLTIVHLEEFIRNKV